MPEIKPYGDWAGDGQVQLSFTLPIKMGERARQAALELLDKMGFGQSMVVHMKEIGLGHTFIVAYGATNHSVSPEALVVTDREFPILTPEKVDMTIRAALKRQMVIVGACTGTDAHTVGLDAILSMKGFAGDKGLEYYHEMRVINLGSQVQPDEIVEVVSDERADAVLVSQVVTQRDAHIRHLEEVRDALTKADLRGSLILVGGGPRFTPEQATPLGYDRIFGRGTKPSDVASYLAWAAAAQRGRAA